MTMRIRGGTDIENGALVLIGDAEAFHSLARLLRSDPTAAVVLDPVVGRPSIRPATGIRFETGGRTATIHTSADTATISGDLEAFVRLAEEIELFLEHNDLAEPGVHTHFDAAAPGAEGVLAETSRDLTLAGPIADEST